IILANRSPLPVAKIWSPQVPALFSRIIFFDPPSLGVHGGCCRSHLPKSKSGGGPIVNTDHSFRRHIRPSRSSDSRSLTCTCLAQYAAVMARLHQSSHGPHP